MHNPKRLPVIQILGQTKSGRQVGILDTPCYPARYYAGVIFNDWPARNDTSLFHRTLQEAEEGAKRFFAL